MPASVPTIEDFDRLVARVRDLEDRLAPRRTAESFLYTKGRGGAPRPDGRYPGWGAHEAPPGITANYDWRAGARPGVDGPPWPQVYSGIPGYRYMNVWFEAIPVAGGMPAQHRNVRLQLTIPKVCHRLGALWNLARPDNAYTNMNGGYWNGGGTYAKTIDWPSTSPNPYWRKEDIGFSVDLTPTTTPDGRPLISQVIAHGFYPSAFYPRLAIGAFDDISIHAWGRLISDDPNVDVDQAQFVFRVSGDAFTSPTASATVNPPLCQTRLLKVGSQWTPTGYISGTDDHVRQIVANHPLLNERQPA